MVDDEVLARKRLLRFLRTESDVEIVEACANGRQAIAAIRRTRPDVVFLDVQMPELDGFEVVRSLDRERPPLVVFVTAYNEHAVRAFEVRALDYLLKPFGLERFQRAFERVRLELERDTQDYSKRLMTWLEQFARDRDAGEDRVEPARRRWLDRLMIKTGGRVFFLKVGELDWLEAADNYVRLHVGKEVHLVRETLTALESSLDPSQFARIHRRAIVNLDRIREMHPGVARDYLVILKDGTELKLSHRYREALEERSRLMS